MKSFLFIGVLLDCSVLLVPKVFIAMITALLRSFGIESYLNRNSKLFSELCPSLFIE